MADAAPVNKPPGWLSSIPKDPLKEKDKRVARNIMLRILFGSVESSFFDVVPIFVEQLRGKGPEKIVSLLPEKNFNAFTLVEYVLTYLAYIIDDQSESKVTFDFEKSKYYDTIDELDALLKELFLHLKSTSTVDQEQTRRVKVLYGIILDASRYRNRQNRFKDDGRFTGYGTPEREPSSFSANFPNEKERMFMAKLRQTLTNSEFTPAENIYQQLTMIFEWTDLDDVFSSDTHIYVALLMILASVHVASSKPSPRVLTLEQYEFLFEKFCKLNRLTFVLALPSYALVTVAKARIVSIRCFMQRSLLNADFSHDDYEKFLARENLLFGS